MAGLKKNDTDSGRYSYQCYGLVIQSDFEFAELEPHAQKTPDLVIHRRQNVTSADAIDQIVQDIAPQHQRLNLPGVAQIEISKGKTIDVSLYDGVDDRVLGLPILGPAMAAALHARGDLVLHGSALIIDDQLTVFVGARGAGKSTTAAALVSSGFTLFNDDLVAVRFDAEGRALAHAGYPAIKVGPDVYAHFSNLDGHLLQTPNFPYQKVRLRLTRETALPPMPIARVCLLERGEEVRFERLDESRALGVLMEHSYMMKYGDAALANGRGAHHFIQCSNLTTQTQTGVLRTPNSLERLNEIIPHLRSIKDAKT